MNFADPETFTVITRTVTGRDSMGNRTYTPVETTVTGAFAPAGSTELVQGQDTIISNPTIYLTDGTPAPAPTARIVVRGVTFEVDGEPLVFHNPFTGSEPGAVVRLVRVDG